MQVKSKMKRKKKMKVLMKMKGKKNRKMQMTMKRKMTMKMKIQMKKKKMMQMKGKRKRKGKNNVGYEKIDVRGRGQTRGEGVRRARKETDAQGKLGIQASCPATNLPIKMSQSLSRGKSTKEKCELVIAVCRVKLNIIRCYQNYIFYKNYLILVLIFY